MSESDIMFVLLGYIAVVVTTVAVAVMSNSPHVRKGTGDSAYPCHICGTPVRSCFPEPSPCCTGCHHGGAMRHRAYASTGHRDRDDPSWCETCGGICRDP